MENRSGCLPNLIILVSAYLIIKNIFFTPEVNYPELSQRALESVPTPIYYEKLLDPLQTSYGGNDFIDFENGDLSLKIYPKAHYQIYAMVMSKKKYSWGWESKIAPYDLALAWNKLMLPENRKGIKYSQRHRWYYFSYENSYPLSERYIYRHSANTHAIPANENVRKALDQIRKGDKVYLEGYLVKMNGTLGNGTVWWNSSLTRNDTGDGACEVMYIKKIILNSSVYE